MRRAGLGSVHCRPSLLQDPGHKYRAEYDRCQAHQPRPAAAPDAPCPGSSLQPCRPEPYADAEPGALATAAVLQAIEHFVEGKSVVVCAPTGAGKTVIAEAAAAAALARGQRVIYTTPLKVGTGA